MKSKVKDVLKYLKRVLTRFVGRKINAEWATEPDALGYTMKGNTVYIANEHDLFKGLNEKEKTAMQIGVGIHEGLHQMFTDFSALERYVNRILDKEDRPKNVLEMDILQTINNILEDAYIEQRAQSEIGGTPLKCLNYQIEEIYKKAPRISESKDALVQYMNALINYGDMGAVKGSFTFDEAREVFNRTAEYFSEGIYEDEPIRRAHLSYRIFREAEPLWRDTSASYFDMMKKFIESLMGETSSECPSGGGMSMPIPPELEEALRQEAKSFGGSRKTSGKEMREDGGLPSSEGSRSDDSSDSDGSASDENSDEGKDSSQDGESGKSDKDGDKSKGGKSGAESSPSDSSLDKKKGDWETSVPDLKSRLEGRESFDASSKKDVDEMEASMGASEEATSTPKGKSVKSLTYDGNGDKNPAGKNYTCLNKDMSNERCHDEYVQLRDPLLIGIKRLAKTMNDIFQAKEEETWKTRGKFSTLRYAQGTTARIFSKKTESRSRVSCMILVDESGSMSGANKWVHARNAAILIAEACHRAQIPCYVMGFEADTDGHDVVHNHYVGWNPHESLEPLVQIHPGRENHDDFSLRTAGKILGARTEANRILFVISDGEPACRAYYSRDIPNPDKAVMDAIKDMRHKDITVFGVGLQGISPKKLEMYYGNDSCFCSDASQLGSVLSKKLVKIIKDV